MQGVGLRSHALQPHFELANRCAPSSILRMLPPRTPSAWNLTGAGQRLHVVEGVHTTCFHVSRPLWDSCGGTVRRRTLGPFRGCNRGHTDSACGRVRMLHHQRVTSAGFSSINIPIGGLGRNSQTSEQLASGSLILCQPARYSICTTSIRHPCLHLVTLQLACTLENTLNVSERSLGGGRRQSFYSCHLQRLSVACRVHFTSRRSDSHCIIRAQSLLHFASSLRNSSFTCFCVRSSLHHLRRRRLRLATE